MDIKIIQNGINSAVTIPDPISNEWGRVCLDTPDWAEGAVIGAELELIYPTAELATWRAKGAVPPTRARARMEGDALVLGHGLGLKLSSRPLLLALCGNAMEIDQAIREAGRAASDAAQIAARASDEALIAPARIEATEYAAAIPADHALLDTRDDPNAADGGGSIDYSYHGHAVRWDFAGLIHRTFSAVRPGAGGAFWTRVVAHAPRAALDALAADAQIKRAEREAASARRADTLRSTPIPSSALAAYDRYDGNADRAWEAGDESACFAIKHWAPYIEAQAAAPAATSARVAEESREAAREARFGQGSDE